MSHSKRDGEKQMHAYVGTVRKQSAELTGLVCPPCRQPVGVIEDVTPPVLTNGLSRPRSSLVRQGTGRPDALTELSLNVRF